jgi:hypothetical protein
MCVNIYIYIYNICILHKVSIHTNHYIYIYIIYILYIYIYIYISKSGCFHGLAVHTLECIGFMKLKLVCWRRGGKRRQWPAFNSRWLCVSHELPLNQTEPQTEAKLTKAGCCWVSGKVEAMARNQPHIPVRIP